MRSMIHISAIVSVLFIAVEIFAEQPSDITTATEASKVAETTRANLANETEYVDTAQLIKEYHSTNPADNDTATTVVSSSTPAAPEHSSISSTPAENVTVSTPATAAAAAENKTMTPEEIQRLLLPPAKVEASILHLNASDEVHEKIIK